MTRIAGVNISDNKQVLIALTMIYGIGISRSRHICITNNINEYLKIRDLSDKEIEKIRNSISRLTVEGDLRREVTLNIKRLIDLGSYRGLRHRRSLPVRGQRTKTNARTCKNMRKFAKK